MTVLAQDLATQAIDLLLSPITLASIAMVCVAVFSGVAGRIVLRVEAVAATRKPAPVEPDPGTSGPTGPISRR
jgi:hypothetical protein